MSTPTIIIRTKSVEILGSLVKAVKDSKWKDNDPWVQLFVPVGPVVEQDLLGTEVNGYFSGESWESIYKLLYQTQIPENSQYPCTAGGLKYIFSTDGSEFIITLEDNQGVTYTCSFYNVRIKTIKLDRLPTSGLKEAVWIVNFVADYVQYQRNS